MVDSDCDNALLFLYVSAGCVLLLLLELLVCCYCCCKNRNAKTLPKKKKKPLPSGNVHNDDDDEEIDSSPSFPPVSRSFEMTAPPSLPRRTSASHSHTHPASAGTDSTATSATPTARMEMKEGHLCVDIGEDGEDDEDGCNSPNVFDMNDANGDLQATSSTTTNEPAMRGFILKSSVPVDTVDTTPTTIQDETTTSSAEPSQTAATEIPRTAPVIPPKPKIDLAVLMGLSESKYDLPPPPPPKPAKTAGSSTTHPSMSESSFTEPGQLPGPPMSLAASQRRAALPPPPPSSSLSSSSSPGWRDYSNRSVEDLRRSRVEEEKNDGGDSEEEERYNVPPSRHAPSITPQKPRRQAPTLPAPPSSLRLSTRSSFSSDSGNSSNTTTINNNNNTSNNNNSARVGPVEPPRPRRQAPALVLQSDPYGAPPSRVVGPPPKPSKPALPEKPRKPSFIQIPSSGGDVGGSEYG